MVVVRSPWILALISFPLLGLVFVEMQVHLLQANIQQYSKLFIVEIGIHHIDITA